MEKPSWRLRDAQVRGQKSFPLLSARTRFFYEERHSQSSTERSIGRSTDGKYIRGLLNDGISNQRSPTVHQRGGFPLSTDGATIIPA